MCSAMAVPNCVMHSASQGGTRPPWSGRSAVPERFIFSFSPKTDQAAVFWTATIRFCEITSFSDHERIQSVKTTL